MVPAISTCPMNRGRTRFTEDIDDGCMVSLGLIDKQQVNGGYRSCIAFLRGGFKFHDRTPMRTCCIMLNELDLDQ